MTVSETTAVSLRPIPSSLTCTSHQPSDVSDELRALWGHAAEATLEPPRRPRALRTIRRDVDDDVLLDARRWRAGALWTIGDDDATSGLRARARRRRGGRLRRSQRRRERVATTLLHALVAGERPPKDGYALPGDRGMKSLYESLGWKARLLTMRGE